MMTTKVITGSRTRWSYVNAWEPKSTDGQPPRYSVSLIISKDDKKTIQKINAAMEAAYREGEKTLTGNGKTCPSYDTLKKPLRDGDKEKPDDPAYKNAYFVNAKSAQKPQIVDRDMQPIIERSEVYSGVMGRASISFYAFSKNGNRGIACALNHLQKLYDGEPLGSRSSAESDFATADDDDADFLS